jgi:hypothetical protein
MSGDRAGVNGIGCLQPAPSGGGFVVE